MTAKPMAMLRTLLGHRFVRFLLVGGLNTLFGYGVFCLFIWMGLHYALAALFSTVLGILFNFKTTGTLVFGSSDNRRIVRFFLVYGVMYALNVGGLRVLGKAGLGSYAAGAILLLPAALAAFWLQRTFVFGR